MYWIHVANRRNKNGLIGHGHNMSLLIHFVELPSDVKIIHSHIIGITLHFQNKRQSERQFTANRQHPKMVQKCRLQNVQMCQP